MTIASCNLGVRLRAGAAKGRTRVGGGQSSGQSVAGTQWSKRGRHAVVKAWPARSGQSVAGTQWSKRGRHVVVKAWTTRSGQSVAGTQWSKRGRHALTTPVKACRRGPAACPARTARGPISVICLIIHFTPYQLINVYLYQRLLSPPPPFAAAGSDIRRLPHHSLHPRPAWGARWTGG